MSAAVEGSMPVAQLLSTEATDDEARAREEALATASMRAAARASRGGLSWSAYPVLPIATRETTIEQEGERDAYARAAARANAFVHDDARKQADRERRRAAARAYRARAARAEQEVEQRLARFRAQRDRAIAAEQAERELRRAQAAAQAADANLDPAYARAAARANGAYRAEERGEINSRYNALAVAAEQAER